MRLTQLIKARDFETGFLKTDTYSETILFSKLKYQSEMFSGL
jgi:hypothetical protein